MTLHEREEARLALLTHLVQGARAAAVTVLDRHLMRFPFDLVAHQGAALTDDDIPSLVKYFTLDCLPT